MPAQFAIVVSPACTVPAGQQVGDEAPGLASQVVAGPGFWEDLLGGLRREGLVSALLADGVIARAVAEADHGHKLDRTLTAEEASAAREAAVAEAARRTGAVLRGA